MQNHPPQRAIQAGFDRALLTITDANVTTFFVAIILLSIGSGPVRGFAVTLAVGIVTSMFTAILVTRALVNLMFGGRKFGVIEDMRTLQIDFMGKRKVALIVSVSLLLVALLSLATRGLNQGLDFTGGSLLEVGFSQEVDPEVFVAIWKALALITARCSISALTGIC